MARLCTLFSGSSGNSVYINHQGEGILIDAGRSAKQIERCLLDNDINIKAIRAIFITHEHNDHVSGLKIFASRYGINAYSSKGTLLSLEKKGILNGKFIYDVVPEKGININSMHITAFRTSHDCSEGVGYVVNLSNGIKVAVCTDLGFISNEVKEAISGCKVLVIESNHDVQMLKNGPYPGYLKRRILSEKGHLSNRACASVLPHLVKNGLNRIILSHLSSENNTRDLAVSESLRTLSTENMNLDEDFTLNVAPKNNYGEFKILF